MFDDLSTHIQNHLDSSHGVFYLILIAGLLATVVVVLLHLILAVLGGRTAERRVPWTWWERLVYLATLLSVGTLGVTAFYAVLRFGILEGWWLFVHMFGAGALVALLPLLALTWFIPNQFGLEESNEDDQRRGSSLRSWIANADLNFAPRFFWMPKVLFWILITSGLVSSLTMLVSMLPLFGTDGLIYLLDIHRYAGLIAVVVMVLHLNCVFMQRLGLR